MELRIREVDESAGQPLRQAQGPGFCTVSELASGEPAEPVELAVKLRARKIFAVCLHLP